jgi:hypothetical protein
MAICMRVRYGKSRKECGQSEIATRLQAEMPNRSNKRAPPKAELIYAKKRRTEMDVCILSGYQNDCWHHYKMLCNLSFKITFLQIFMKVI